jgi:hypothetical protein
LEEFPSLISLDITATQITVVGLESLKKFLQMQPNVKSVKNVGYRIDILRLNNSEPPWVPPVYQSDWFNEFIRNAILKAPFNVQTEMIDSSEKRTDSRSFSFGSFSDSITEEYEVLNQKTLVMQKKIQTVPSLDIPDSIEELPCGKRLPSQKLETSQDNRKMSSMNTENSRNHVNKKDDDDSIELIDISMNDFVDNSATTALSSQGNKAEYYVLLPLTNLTTILPTIWYQHFLNPVSTQNRNTSKSETKNKKLIDLQEKAYSIINSNENNFLLKYDHNKTSIKNSRGVRALDGEPKRVIRRTNQKLNAMFVYTTNKRKQKKRKQL